MLRAIPNLNVLRPCDEEETLACFEIALNNKETPSAIILSRQNLPYIEKDTQNYNRGGYVISACENPDVVIIATGSEVNCAVKAKEILSQKSINARGFNAMFRNFDKQDETYKKKFWAIIKFCE